MAYAVQKFDYAGLVERMFEAGIDKMAEVLNSALAGLPKPQWENEKTYFWYSLFNAAREQDAVWLWLSTAPHIRQFAPPEVAAGHVYPQFASDLELPVIGGPDDQPAEKPKMPKQWSDEPTTENFRQQAEALDAFLQAEGQKNPSNACKTVADYVASFYYSGTGQMMARVQLTEAGYHALATQEGIRWLMETYPPK